MTLRYAIVEIWCRAESVSKKGWTDQMQPYSPFLVFERSKKGVSCYIDERGIAWMKGELVTLAKQDPNFISLIEQHFGDAYDTIDREFLHKEVLGIDELRRMLGELEHFWTWFEAGWWLWESTQEELQGLTLPESLAALRNRTQDLVPRAEILIRTSLQRIFPDAGALIESISGVDIEKGKLPDRATLEARMAGYYLVGEELQVGARREDIEARYGIALEHVVTNGVSEVKGQIAFKGSVRGKARIVYGVKQMHAVELGDIIISPMTMPDILPAMQKAAGFVTDEGGIMCHAAIIAREMQKPCVIGTKVATEVFKDGDIVEVDAEKGIVRKI